MRERIELGRMNRLEVRRAVDFGLYLDAGEVGEVLLPARYVPTGAQVGDTLDVFLYLDSEERLVATTETPLVQVGQFACLSVKWTNRYGAFLDWGLTKDLFCPFAQQKGRMAVGERHVVYCYIDPLTYRILCSERIERFFSHEPPAYRPAEAVEGLVCAHTPLGWKVIIADRHEALLQHTEALRPLSVGDRLTVYVKQVRLDGKIDLSLRPGDGRERAEDFSACLLDYLRQAKDGFCPLHDKSPAEDIYHTFGVSKKTFKQAVGRLYKQGLITLHTNGLRITVAGITQGMED